MSVPSNRSRWLRLATCAALVAFAGGAAQAQGAPGWLKLLHWISGNDDRTDVPITMMGTHMQMTRPAPRFPGDSARAEAIVRAAADVLRRYPDPAAAERDGYKLFHQAGTPGEEVHFTSLRYSYAEGGHVDYAHPGSLLFRREARGLVPVGVMYAAPGKADVAALDARAPLSIAAWHRHVDFCWRLNPNAAAEQAGPRFGYGGSIHDEGACRAARGYWLPLAFGWMTHVYPARARPWGGEQMTPGGDMHG